MEGNKTLPSIMTSIQLAPREWLLRNWRASLDSPFLSHPLNYVSGVYWKSLGKREAWEIQQMLIFEIYFILPMVFNLVFIMKLYYLQMRLHSRMYLWVTLFILGFCFCFCVFETGFSVSGYSGTHSTDQAGLGLRSPASSSYMLGLKACTTTTWLQVWFLLLLFVWFWFFDTGFLCVALAILELALTCFYCHYFKNHLNWIWTVSYIGSLTSGKNIY